MNLTKEILNLEYESGYRHLEKINEPKHLHMANSIRNISRVGDLQVWV